MSHTSFDALDSELDREEMPMNGEGDESEAGHGIGHNFIDKRVLGKPGCFDGSDSAWADWDFAFSNWFACLDDQAEELLEAAANSEVAITMDSLTEPQRKLSRALYLVLTQLVKNKSLSIVKGIAAKNGFEAYRKLRKEYAPKSSNRVTSMLLKLISEEFKNDDFASAVQKWENEKSQNCGSMD